MEFSLCGGLKPSTLVFLVTIIIELTSSLMVDRSVDERLLSWESHLLLRALDLLRSHSKFFTVVFSLAFISSMSFSEYCPFRYFVYVGQHAPFHLFCEGTVILQLVIDPPRCKPTKLHGLHDNLV